MCRSRNVLSMFFFFQAEDGIRDLTVTGVQTCALPFSNGVVSVTINPVNDAPTANSQSVNTPSNTPRAITDRKSTRLNSSHSQISYAVFCLKKKNHIAFANLDPTCASSSDALDIGTRLN